MFHCLFIPTFARCLSILVVFPRIVTFQLSQCNQKQSRYLDPINDAHVVVLTGYAGCKSADRIRTIKEKVSKVAISCTEMDPQVTALSNRKGMLSKCLNHMGGTFRQGIDGDVTAVPATFVNTCSEGDRYTWYSIAICCPGEYFTEALYSRISSSSITAPTWLWDRCGRNSSPPSSHTSWTGTCLMLWLCSLVYATVGVCVSISCMHGAGLLGGGGRISKVKDNIICNDCASSQSKLGKIN